MNELIALKCDEKDNVATVFSNDVTKGSVVTVRNKKGEKMSVEVREDVPYGHKIALCAIEKGGHITKYGETIGGASLNIVRGDYVHVHNLEALRGRGDR